MFKLIFVHLIDVLAALHSQKYVSQYVSEIANFIQHLPEAM